MMQCCSTAIRDDSVFHSVNFVWANHMHYHDNKVTWLLKWQNQEPDILQILILNIEHIWFESEDMLSHWSTYHYFVSTKWQWAEGLSKAKFYLAKWKMVKSDELDIEKRRFSFHEQISTRDLMTFHNFRWRLHTSKKSLTFWKILSPKRILMNEHLREISWTFERQKSRSYQATYCQIIIEQQQKATYLYYQLVHSNK